ncbi:MAG: CBS domain-containing protein [Deltaproteobacteria bacterium]|nr:CBS domain-containing protein [Deltaproteobacteria bacterium]
MLLRKRAWDIMREEYPSVRDDASISQVIQALEGGRKNSSDLNFVVVFDRSGAFKGVVSMWNIIQSIGPCLLSGLGLLEKEVNWDQAFHRACRTCAQVDLGEYLQRDVPVVKPNDPLARILEIFLGYRRGRAVVEEGGKIIGIVVLADLYREIGLALDQS